MRNPSNAKASASKTRKDNLQVALAEPARLQNAEGEFDCCLDRFEPQTTDMDFASPADGSSSWTSTSAQPPAHANQRKRSRRSSAGEGTVQTPTSSPSAPRSKKARVGGGSEGGVDGSSGNEIPASTGKNARRKQRERQGKAGKKEASMEKRPELDEDQQEAQEAQEQDDGGEGNDPFSQPNPVMTDVRSQLPPASHPPTNATAPPCRISTAENIIASGDVGQLSQDALQSLSKMWKELTDQKESLIQYMEGRSDSSSPETYHKAAYRGKVLLDWLDENTWAIRGVVNNRGQSETHAKNILKSIKAFGHQGHKHPIIVIVKAGEVPPDVEWNEEAPPRLTFSSKTAVGIVAGAHRLRALLLFCTEADTLIKAAQEYLTQLKADLESAGITEVAKQDLALIQSNIETTLERLIQERNAVANWPTLVYNWDSVLAQTGDGKRLRDELSINHTLAVRNANAAERLGQLWRLADKQGRDGMNILMPGSEKTLWKCTESWRPFLGHLAQFPAFQSELSGHIARYGALASASHWPGAAIFVLLHCLSGLETLFEPVALPDQLDLTPEYWKQLLTCGMVKDLGDLLKRHGRDLIQSGAIFEWKRKHAEAYWLAVDALFEVHFPQVAEYHDKAIFQNAFARTLQARLKSVKERLVLPLYTKELRESVFSWFQLAAPGFYAIADMIDTNWMTFSSKADQWSYGDAGSHIIRCLQARTIAPQQGGTQDIQKLDVELTRYIVKALYEPAWVTLSAWLAARGHSDALNGVMKQKSAQEGVPKLNKDDLKPVTAMFKALRQLTGPHVKPDPPKEPNELQQNVLETYRSAEEQVQAAYHWWMDWTRLGHVHLRTDWPSPLSQDAISRMTTSYHRTLAEPAIWGKISERREFPTIFSIFRDVPSHCEAEEQLLGWAMELPWDGEKQSSLVRSPTNVNTPQVQKHRDLCQRGYYPFETKIKGRRGGAPKVITSVDQLPQLDTLHGLDPFGLGISVSSEVHFWGYMQIHFFHPRMWPAYTQWDQLKVAMERWQKHDLEWLELVLETAGETLKRRKSIQNLWEMLVQAWEALAFWCMAELVAPGGMRNSAFPLPSLDGIDPQFSLTVLFAELQQFRRGNEQEVHFAVPPHFETSDAIRQLIENHIPGVKLGNLLYVQPDEKDFEDVGTAWIKVKLMDPKPKPRWLAYAILFHILAKEATGGWSTADSDILSLLAFNEDPQYAEAASLPTIYQTFNALWPLLYPKKESPSADDEDDDEDEGINDLPGSPSQWEDDEMIDPCSGSNFASHRKQDQDGDQDGEPDEDYDPWAKEDDFVSLGQDVDKEQHVDMEQDQAMEAQDQDLNVGKKKVPKPAVVQVTNHLQDMEIDDDIDIPAQPSVLVPLQGLLKTTLCLDTYKRLLVHLSIDPSHLHLHHCQQARG